MRGGFSFERHRGFHGCTHGLWRWHSLLFAADEHTLKALDAPLNRLLFRLQAAAVAA